MSLSSLRGSRYPSWIVKLDSDYSRAGSFKIFALLVSFVELPFSVTSCVQLVCPLYATFFGLPEDFKDMIITSILAYI